MQVEEAGWMNFALYNLRGETWARSCSGRSFTLTPDVCGVDVATDGCSAVACSGGEEGS